MNTQGIKVLRSRLEPFLFQVLDGDQTSHLHVANRDTIVPAIPHDLILNLLPALHALLDKHLWTCGERLPTEVPELLLVLRKPTAEPTKRIRRADDDGEPDLLRGRNGLVSGRGGCALRAPLADLDHCVGEPLPVLRLDDRLDGRTENSHTECLEFVLELDADIQRRLSAKGHIYPVRLLVLDNLAHKVGRHRQEVDFVREALRGRDRRDVRVDEDGVDPFLLECFERLRTRVVKFARLADREAS